MIRASEGRALINGADAHLNKKKAMTSAGALIKSPEIYPSLTPREPLSIVAEIRGLPRAEAKKIEQTVAEVKMNECSDKKVGKFSKEKNSPKPPYFAICD
jgi:ABC-type multidrug transport system ATPase subunit